MCLIDTLEKDLPFSDSAVGRIGSDSHLQKIYSSSVEKFHQDVCNPHLTAISMNYTANLTSHTTGQSDISDIMLSENTVTSVHQVDRQTESNAMLEPLDTEFKLHIQMLSTPLWFFAYCCTAIVVGITLNILTIIVLRMGRKIHEEVKFQLINLAAADLLVACCLPTLNILNFFMTDAVQTLAPPDYQMCKVIIWLVLTATGASPLFNMLISLERFVVICFPLKARFYTKTLKRLAAVITWFITFTGEAYVFALGSDNFDSMEDVTQVGICKVRVRSLGALGLVWLLIQISIPTVTIIFCYTCIVIKLCRQHTLGDSANQIQEKVRAKQAREVRMIT